MKIPEIKSALQALIDAKKKCDPASLMTGSPDILNFAGAALTTGVRAARVLLLLIDQCEADYAMDAFGIRYEIEAIFSQEP